MLPFLVPKKMAGTIIAKTKATGGVVDEQKEDEQHPELMAIAEGLIRAVHGKDATAVAESFLKLFKHAELMPHKEYEQEEGE